MKELFVFSKKEDQKLVELGGEFASGLVSWEETDWYYSKYHENFEVLGHTRKSKNGFYFNERRIGVYQPEKGKVVIYNKYDKESREEVDKQEFFSDPETWIEIIDTEKGKEEFIKEKEYLKKRAEEAEKKAKQLKELEVKLNEALKRKGGLKFTRNTIGNSIHTIEYVTAVGSAYIEATIWNGGMYCGHKSTYTSLLSGLGAIEWKTKEEVIKAILE